MKLYPNSKVDFRKDGVYIEDYASDGRVLAKDFHAWDSPKGEIYKQVISPLRPWESEDEGQVSNRRITKTDPVERSITYE
jgi:hypothetical protein